VRFGLLATLSLAGMLQWMTPQAAAAPVMPAAIAAVMPESSADLVYYYQGHHYPYRYGGHYHSHRAVTGALSARLHLVDAATRRNGKLS
jgi:hypothetical protein